jgi:hypothetical protein
MNLFRMSTILRRLGSFMSMTGLVLAMGIAIAGGSGLVIGSSSTNSRALHEIDVKSHALRRNVHDTLRAYRSIGQDDTFTSQPTGLD